MILADVIKATGTKNFTYLFLLAVTVYRSLFIALNPALRAIITQQHNERFNGDAVVKTELH